MSAKKSFLTSSLIVLIIYICATATATAQEPVPILELGIPDTARVVDYDNGIYVVGTSGGNLYVINEAGEYTVTAIGAGSIQDVRIEHPFVAVAEGSNTVLKFSLNGLTPVGQWGWSVGGQVKSVDISGDGVYIAYLSTDSVGVFNSSNGTLVDSWSISGAYPNVVCWLDATDDMEYIAITTEILPYGSHNSGVELYRFDGSSISHCWGSTIVSNYDTTEVRVSEAKDYVAVATSSGTYMNCLRLTDGIILWSHETLGKEQYACDGDDNLSYIIGANQDWTPPYPWFVLKNFGTSYAVVASGEMNGPINDLDSNADATLLAFGSDAGEFILLRRSNDSIGTVFEGDVDNVIDAIEIGDTSLLVGGQNFINLYSHDQVTLELAKVDDVDDCAGMGREINYYIEYNYRDVSITNANIIDYLPDEVEFVSAMGGLSYNYNPGSHTVTWEIGTLEPGSEGYVALTVKVKYHIGSIITNKCELRNGEAVLNGYSAYENTPVCCLIVDDFESYNNTYPERIQDTWIAGGGGTVGYPDADYAERININGGAQSMLFDYDNTSPPYYSDATRTFATSQDWTTFGLHPLNSLTLWFRGYQQYVGSFVQSGSSPNYTYTMTASGRDIGGELPTRGGGFHDELHYAYKKITAITSGTVVEIKAKVEDIVSSNASAKAGVMFRNSLDATSTEGMTFVMPLSSNPGSFRYRLTTGGSTGSDTEAGITDPYWVKLTVTYALTGGQHKYTLRPYRSTNNINWTGIGGGGIPPSPLQETIIAPSLTYPLYIGLAVTAGDAAASCTATFSNVSTSVISGTATITPATWSLHQDIGIKSNVAAPLYVTLEDSNPTPGIKKFTHPDPDIVLKTDWQQWNIPFSNFTGVDLTKVKKITIGVGDSTPPGIGTLYFDDISIDKVESVHNITWNYWYSSIQEAIDEASNGDEIEVYPGTYHESIDFEGKPITIRSTLPGTVPTDWSVVESTIIDGDGAYSTVYLTSGESANSILKGFTIRGGNSSGISASSNATIRHCIIEENQFGISCFGYGAPIIENNKIRNNTWGIMDNYGSAAPIVRNNWIYNNDVGIQHGGISTVFSNNTIVNNTDGILNYGYAPPVITNCILWNNGDDLCYCSATYSCIKNCDDVGNPSITHNICSNPYFVDDYHLSKEEPQSLCINAGHPYGGAYVGQTDIDGENRVKAGRVDIGADEVDEVHNITQDRWYFVIQDAINRANNGDEIVVYPGTYNRPVNFNGKAITLRSVNPNDWAVVEATIIDGNTVSFSSGEGANSILKGLTITVGGIVCGGSVTPLISNCIIEDSPSFGISCVGGGSPTITNCKIRNNGVGIYANYGTTNFVVKNTMIYKNGSGIYQSTAGSPTVTNSTIVSNTNYGISCLSSATITNCILWNNGDDLSGCSATYSCIEDNDSGQGNIHSDPLFVNADVNDFHLGPNSPCIDIGNPNLNYAGQTDIDGDNRVIDIAGKGDGNVDVDMGADEYDPNS